LATKNALIVPRRDALQALEAWRRAFAVVIPTILAPDRNEMVLYKGPETGLKLQRSVGREEYKDDTAPIRPIRTIVAEFITTNLVLRESNELRLAAIEQYLRCLREFADHRLDVLS
jgi:hypothetical protein